MLFIVGCTQETPAPPAATPTPEATTEGDQEDPGDVADDEWMPTGPITVVVGFGAGGGIDVMARTMQPALESYLGVPIIVENMPGAASGIAGEYVLTRPADGYTIWAMSSSIDVFSTSANADFTWKDFTPIIMPFMSHNLVLQVGADSGIYTVDDWVEFVTNNNTTCATLGIGSSYHLPALVLAYRLDILDQVTFIPYDRGMDTTLSVARGETDWATSSVGLAARDSIIAGHVRPLAMMGPYEFYMEGYGRIPSIMEYDLPTDLSDVIDLLGGYRAFVVRAGTPQNVIDTLARALDYGNESEAFQNLLAENGVDKFVIARGAVAHEIMERSARIFSWMYYDVGGMPRSPLSLDVERWEG